MEFYKGMAIALVISALIWTGVIYTAFLHGYEEGKSFQKLSDSNALMSCQRLAGIR